MVDNDTILTKYNHNDRGNPHPQYDHFNTYLSPTNVGQTTRYIKIFEGNFHLHPENLDVTNREYNRLIYKADIYNMVSDDNQSLTEFSMLCMIKYDNTFYYEIANRTALGSKDRTITLYYKTDSTTGITNVKVYVQMNSNNEHVKIIPKLYDTVFNNKTPYHLKAAGEGVNIRQKLDNLYSDFSIATLLTDTDLATTVSGYTSVTAMPNKLYGLNLAGANLNNLILLGSNPGLKFNSPDNSTTYGKLYYSASSLCMSLETGGIDLRSDCSLVPLNSARNIGADWSPWSKGYFSGGIAPGKCTFTARPTTGLYDTLTLFETDTHRLITYYDGSWYSNGSAV